jgi:hypothetical protein
LIANTTALNTGILLDYQSGNTALNWTTANMSQHVPAWKKIGLKLKYAKETADDTPTVSATTETNGDSHAGAKRSRDEDADQENPSKRNKTREIRLESPAPRSILSGSQSPTKTPAGKKAVSFSAETKAEDGETGQNYFKAWAAGNTQPHTPPKPSTEIVVPETPESAEKPTTDSPADNKAKSKASKREKKAEQAAAQHQDVEGMRSLQERRESKAAKKAAKQERKAIEAHQPASPAATSTTATATATAPPSAYVDFLHQFHHDRPNWKFNKSKENHLLKNVWSMYRVPAQYTEALVAYVAGLQGAGARTRLVEGADEVLRDVAEKGGRKFDFNGFEEPATRREAYSNAIDNLTEASSANLEQADIDRAARAQAVLTQLLNYAPLPVTIEKPAKPAAAPKPAAATTPAQLPIALQDAPPVRPPPVMAAPPPTANDRDQRRVVWTAEKIAAAGGAKRIQFDDDDDEPPAPKPKAAAAAKPARRRRKARTDVSSSEESSSDSSSSDSSSSDSSSDSDSD